MLLYFSGGVHLKVSTFLLIIIVAMHFVSLTNITLFNGEWNGIVVALNTILFISAIAIYVSNRKKKEVA